jgi:hypothetical protein
MNQTESELVDELVDRVCYYIDKVALAIEDHNKLLRSQQEQKTKKTRTRKLDRDDLYTPEFLACWDAYPKKQQKQAAAKAYRECVKRINEFGLHLVHGCSDGHEVLLAKCKLYGEAWPQDRVKRGDYRLNMSTFLNQDRWEENPQEWDETSQASSQFEAVQGPRWEP